MVGPYGRTGGGDTLAEERVTPERWRRLRELFRAAAELPPTERRAYLEERCDGDAALLTEVLRMLRNDAGVPLEHADLLGFAAEAFENEPENDPYLGRTFGLYNFKSRLAVGGMSWVYLAERPDYGGVVAIKVLRDVMSLARRQLFEYEKRLLAQMNHPSIARLYDAGTLDDGAAFFVMEFVDGQHIDDYCRQHRLNLHERLALFRQVCEAVRHAHARRIVHRDLKSSNILVQADGAVKLLDFGVSGQAGSAGETAPSSSYMTLVYAAPEQINHELAEASTDVYSLGVLLQQLLTGRLPFALAGKTTAEIRSIVQTTPPLEPSAVLLENSASPPTTQTQTDDSPSDPGVDIRSLGRMDLQDIDHICGKALAKDVAKRYPSAEALVRDIERFEQKQPLEDFTPDRRYVAGRFLQGHYRPLLVAAAVLCCLAGLAGFYTYRLNQARKAALAEVARTDRVERFMEQLLTGDDPNNGPSLDLRVITVLEQGVRDVQALNTDPPIQATLYELLGGLFGTMGSFDKAEPLFRSAIEEQKNIYGEDSAQVADTLASWGMIREKEGKTGEAETMLRQAMAIDARKLPPAHSQAVQAGIGLGLILTNRGAYKDAVSLLEREVALASGKTGMPYDLSSALSNLADAHFYLGELDQAASLYERAIAIDSKLKGDENIDLAEDLMSRAALDERLGRFVKAEGEERHALSIEQHWYRNTDQPTVAGAMTILAQTLVKEHHAPEALSLAEASLAMRQRLQEAPDAGFAHSWNALGQIHKELGDLKASENDHRQALAMYRQFLPGPSYQAGISLDNLAALSFDRGRYEQADGFSQESLKMLTAKLPASDPIIATAEVHYARSLEAQQRFSEAEVQYLAAYAILKQQKEGRDGDLKILRRYLVTLYREKEQPEKAKSYEF